MSKIFVIQRKGKFQEEIVNAINIQLFRNKTDRKMRRSVDIDEDLHGRQSNQNFIYHPLVHTFSFRKRTTTSWGGSEEARVEIKVWDIQSALKNERYCLPRPLQQVVRRQQDFLQFRAQVCCLKLIERHI